MTPPSKLQHPFQPHPYATLTLLPCLPAPSRVASPSSASVSAAQAIGRSQDDIVALLALHARSLALMPATLGVSGWEQHLVADELMGSRWLLAYEAMIKGWLPSANGTDHIAASPLFSAMRTGGVSFYDTSSAGGPPSTVVGRVRAIGGSGYFG